MLFQFTDNVADAEMRYTIGWAFVGVSAFNILANWLGLFYRVGSSLFPVIKRAYLRWKMKRALAQKVPQESDNPV